MTPEQIKALERVTAPGTPWYVFAIHAFSLVPRLLEERKILLEALHYIATEPPGCDAAHEARRAIAFTEAGHEA